MFTGSKFVNYDYQAYFTYSLFLVIECFPWERGTVWQKESTPGVLRPICLLQSNFSQNIWDWAPLYIYQEGGGKNILDWLICKLTNTCTQCVHFRRYLGTRFQKKDSLWMKEINRRSACEKLFAEDVIQGKASQCILIRLSLICDPAILQSGICNPARLPGHIW